MSIKRRRIIERNHFGVALLSTALSIFLALTFLAGYGTAAETENVIEKHRSLLLLESVKQNFLANERLEALRKNHEVSERISLDHSPSLWLKKVKANDVNIVTNRYSTARQNIIILDGKTYYTPGKIYESTLVQNPSLRFARDPLTNNPVDKAEAAIYIDASGRAFYFQSDETFKSFLALADQETLYGYTKP